MSNGVKILVTGGAGFIGSHLVDELIKAGHDVVVIDKLSTGKKENLNPAAKFYKLDVLSDEIKNVFESEKPETVFHLAAQIDVAKSSADPVGDANENIIGSINLLENCKKYKVKKFIFSSTAAVYGDTNQIPTPENHPNSPLSPYGIGKLTIEKYLNYYYNTFHLDYIALRYSNVYGPRQISQGEGGVVAIFCDNLINEKIPVIYGDGKQTRDFIYVKDVVAANLLALESDKVGIYNISTGLETRINDLAKLIKKELKSDIDFTHVDPRPVDQFNSALDNTKAKSELKFLPRITLEQGIKETALWFKR